MRLRPWQLVRRAVTDPVSDAALLARFVEQRDAAAFELLVWRHGAMVLGVCRRVLRNEHDAEDAFQAAFLILARKAGSVRGESLAGWLHRVARRVAIRATKRPRPESLSIDPPDLTPQYAELRTVLDAEIDRLPDRLRLPVVLCYLDGRSTEDAAKQLGVPRGTVLSRLATARKKLAERLTRRGITAALFAAGFVNEAVTANAVKACTATALRFAAGIGGTGVSIQLAEGVLRMGTRVKLVGWALALVMVAGVGTGVGVVAGNAPQGQEEARRPDPAPTEQAKGKKPADPPKISDDERQKLAREVEESKLLQQRLIEREERMRKLDAQAQKLQEAIAKQMDVLGRLHREAADNVDPKALLAAIAKADELILRLEDLRDMTSELLASVQAQLKELGKLKPAPETLNVIANDYPEVQAALAESNRAYQTLHQLKQNTKPDSTLVAQAEKNLKEKSEQATAARQAAYPAAEKAWREQTTREYQDAVKSQMRTLDDHKRQLESTVAKRARLSDRYAKAKQTTDQIQLIEDELKVYREVRQLVIRQRLMMDIGLDEPK